MFWKHEDILQYIYVYKIIATTPLCYRFESMLIGFKIVRCEDVFASQKRVEIFFSLLHREITLEGVPSMSK